MNSPREDCPAQQSIQTGEARENEVASPDGRHCLISSPLALSGEDIPLESRILAIVKAYDAMISERPYRRAMSKEDALAEQKRYSATQFDPVLVEGVIQVLDSCEESCEYPEQVFKKY